MTDVTCSMHGLKNFPENTKNILKNTFQCIHNSEGYFDMASLAAELNLDEAIVSSAIGSSNGCFIVNENGKISLTDRGKLASDSNSW